MKKLTKKVVPVVLAGALVTGMCMPSMAAADAWSIADATKETITVTIDGKAMEVTHYTDQYTDKTAEMDKVVSGAIMGKPTSYNQYENAKVDIYVPEGVALTDDVPVLYKVNNGGWMANTYEGSITIKADGAYAANDGMAYKALSEGCIVVTAGLRTRGLADEAGNYNHSSVTVADAKAVIKYLKYNNVGDSDRIIITGTSGGGALSSAVAASGNSADYADDLEKIGAAPATDDVFAVVAYCPITDLGNADGAYEFTYAETRAQMVADGFSGSNLNDVTMGISNDLAYDWAAYVNSLGLTDANGNALTAAFDTEDLVASGTIYDSMKAYIIGGLQEGLDASDSVTDFYNTLNARTAATSGKGDNVKPAYGTDGTAPADWNVTNDWITVKDGKVVDVDMDKYMYYVAYGQSLKIAPAFTSEGTSVASQSENNLFGQATEAYGFLCEDVWDLEAGGADGTLHKTYGTWENYWATNKALLLKQERMVNSISYLVDDADGDSASYWWVRHGTLDRDTSFANQTLLFNAIANDESIDNYDVAFKFNMGHKGDYDVATAWAFVEDSLAAADAADTPATPDQPTTPDQPATDDGKTESPKTGNNMMPLFAVVIAAGAVALASTRRRVVR